jgi:hypothetical protein
MQQADIEITFCIGSNIFPFFFHYFTDTVRNLNLTFEDHCNGTLPDLAAKFKWRQVPAVEVLSYFYIFNKY